MTSESSAAASATNLSQDEIDVASMEAEWVYGPTKLPINRTIMLKGLQGLKGLTLGGKSYSVPASYGKYEDLPPKNKHKVFIFWDIAKALGRVSAIIESAGVLTGKDETTRRETTTSSEMFRLMCVLQSEDASVPLYQIRHPPQDRQTLDALQSVNADVVRSTDPYAKVAEFFNDRNNVFHNPVVEIDPVTNTRKLATKVPDHISEEYGPINVIYERVKDIDPNIFKMRDGDWVKERYGMIKAWLYKNCRPTVGFYKSGNQDASSIFSCFSRFCAAGGAASWCDATILTPSYVDFFTNHSDDGKDIGDTGIDTGMIGDDVRESRKRAAVSAADRQRKFRHSHKSSASSSKSPAYSTDESSSSPPEVIDLTAFNEQFIKATAQSAAQASNVSAVLQAAQLVNRFPEQYTPAQQSRAHSVVDYYLYLIPIPSDQTSSSQTPVQARSNMSTSSLSSTPTSSSPPGNYPHFHLDADV